RPSGNCCNCLDVIVVTWLVVVTSIAGIRLAVTLTAPSVCTPFADPAKSTATAPAATGLTPLRLCTTLPSCSSDTVYVPTGSVIEYLPDGPTVMVRLNPAPPTIWMVSPAATGTVP